MPKVAMPKKQVENDEYEHTFIRHVKVGETFGAIYYLVSAFEKVAKNGKIYSDLTVRDKSGESFVRLWGESKHLKAGEFVLILATVGEYMGKPQITANEVEVAPTPSQEDMSEYYAPRSETFDEDVERFEKYRERVKKLCEEFEDSTCTDLVEGVFGCLNFHSRFIHSPSSDKNFYGVDGGLLAQTVKVAFVCGNLASQYGLTKQETAILVSAALLHRIGAVDVYEITTCKAEATTKGKLMGCLNYTLQRLHKETQDNEVCDRIVHAVVSQDTSIKPMTKEAIILSEVIRADIRIVSALDFIDQDPNEGEEFTAFDAISKQQYFKG